MSSRSLLRTFMIKEIRLEVSASYEVVLTYGGIHTTRWWTIHPTVIHVILYEQKCISMKIICDTGPSFKIYKWIKFCTSG